MATIQSSIQLNDNFSAVLNNIVNAVNLSISAFEQMQSTMDTEVDPSSMAAVREEINQATIGLQSMQAAAVETGTGIEQDAQKQQEFNSYIDQGATSANQLGSLIKGAVAAYTGVAGIKKAVSWIQDCTSAFDEQLNAENQLMTVLGNTLDADYAMTFEAQVTADTSDAVAQIDAIQSTADTDVVMTVSVDAQKAAIQSEFDSITQKAADIQASGWYGDEAMIAAAGEFATYFSDTDAIEMMMDTLSNYAAGMEGGVSEVDTSAMVDYATNLGKIMTGSYDAMTKKGFEFTDAQKDIIEGTATEQEIVATLGEQYLDCSADMQAAAAITQVIDESWAGLYDTMSDTPQAEIQALKNSFGDLKETVGGELYPYVGALVSVITDNWPTIEGIVDSFTGLLQNAMGMIANIVGAAMNFASVVQDNWGTIKPIIEGIVAALAAYLAISTVVNTINAVSAGVEAVKAAAQMMATDKTFAETAAQEGLNAALLACPVTWLVVAIIALVAAIVVCCNQIAQLTGIANTGFGVITGGVNVVIQFFKNLGLEVANIALGIWDALGAVATNMQTAFQNAIASVQSWFYDLLSTALTVIENICAALNKLPFVSFDYSGITEAADNYAAKSAEAAASKQEYTSVADAFSEGMSTFDTFSDGWASDAFDAGATWGDNVMDKISSFSLSDLFSVDTSDYAVPSAEDYLTSYTGTDFADTAMGDLSDIADNTASTASSLSVTDDELKYLRDIAEQETVNRFTTAEITIEQTNNNNVSSSMDLDGVVDGLTDAVNEAINTITEGVHA